MLWLGVVLPTGLHCILIHPVFNFFLSHFELALDAYLNTHIIKIQQHYTTHCLK